ncbi:MAG TPA: FUN14 domain-containing protein [Candidatus Babeliales bacterium]|nr:FUN14 domain-containing protein [Candidatus Babeliales bacterium]
MLNEGSSQSISLIETLKNTVQPENVARKIGIDKNTLIDFCLYGAIGFILGFLIKKYNEYFIALVLLLVGLIVLQQLDYISLTINLSKIHEMLGLRHVSIIGDRYGTLLLEWIKSNIIGSTSLIIGFLIGLKVG